MSHSQSKVELVEVRIGSKEMMVPCMRIADRSVILTGKWVKTATLRDEMYLDGAPVKDPWNYWVFRLGGSTYQYGEVSQGSGDYTNKLLSAMRKQFGGHDEKSG